MLVAHVVATPPEEIAALAADQRQRHLAGLALQQVRTRFADDVGVEAAAEPPVAGNHEQQRRHAGLVLGQGQQRVGVGFDPRRQIVQQPAHLIGEGPRGEDALLRPPQPRSGDHLHRLRKLLRGLHRSNAAAQVDE